MSTLSTFDLNQWRATRDTLQQYAKLLGKIKQSFIPPEKHYWHFGLYICADGITTGPMLVGEESLELRLNLTSHILDILVSDGRSIGVRLGEKSIKAFCDEVCHNLSILGHEAKIDRSLFTEEGAPIYDAQQAAGFWDALSFVHGAAQVFRSGLKEERSPIQVFPHHFDLSLTWFSGRTVPGVDPKDEDSLYESMGFGFSTGDEGIPEAYLYVTAYATPRGWIEAALPVGARWQTEGWTGAVLPYAAVQASEDPAKLVLDFYGQAQAAAQKLMQ